MLKNIFLCKNMFCQDVEIDFFFTRTEAVNITDLIIYFINPVKTLFYNYELMTLADIETKRNKKPSTCFLIYIYPFWLRWHGIHTISTLV